MRASRAALRRPAARRG